jgi:hypothetical protein
LQDLSTLREGWDSLQRDELRLLRALSTHESLRQWLELQRAFEWQLQQTVDLFGVERQTALIELQARLLRLAVWQSNGESISIDPGTSESSE